MGSRSISYASFVCLLVGGQGPVVSCYLLSFDIQTVGSFIEDQ